MLYSFISGSNGLVNHSDLAIRTLEDGGKKSYDIIVRTLDEKGNVLLHSVGTLKPTDLQSVAGGYFYSKRPDKLVWVNSIPVRQMVFGDFDFCYEKGREQQAMIVIAGSNHRIELNRDKLRSWEGGRGGFSMLRLMAGDVARIDDVWITYDCAIRKLSRPFQNMKMTDYSSNFSFTKIVSPTVTPM